MTGTDGDRPQRPQATRRGGRKMLLAAASPVVAAVVGVLTNLATNAWNWWLVTGLAVAILLAALLASWLDRPVPAPVAAAPAPVPDRRTVPETLTMARRPPAGTVARPELTEALWRLLTAPGDATTPRVNQPGGAGWIRQDHAGDAALRRSAGRAAVPRRRVVGDGRREYGRDRSS